jgi:hypothetical protein
MVTAAMRLLLRAAWLVVCEILGGPFFLPADRVCPPRGGLDQDRNRGPQQPRHCPGYFTSSKCITSEDWH